MESEANEAEAAGRGRSGADAEELCFAGEMIAVERGHDVAGDFVAVQEQLAGEDHAARLAEFTLEPPFAGEAVRAVDPGVERSALALHLQTQDEAAVAPRGGAGDRSGEADETGGR